VYYNLYRECLFLRDHTVLLSKLQSSPLSIYYPNAEYLHKNKCGRRDTLRSPFSKDVTLSQKVLCITIVQYTSLSWNGGMIQSGCVLSNDRPNEDVSQGYRKLSNGNKVRVIAACDGLRSSHLDVFATPREIA
jgi:hypothetical protein